jgi:hypothetical protein
VKDNSTRTKKQLTEITQNRVSRAERDESNGIPPALTSAWTSQKVTESVSQFGNFSNFEKYPRIVTIH